MTMLVDFQIDAQQRENRIVTPYDPGLLQPASLDVRLGTGFVRFLPAADGRPKMISEERIAEDGDFALGPGAMALGHTLEVFRVPAHMALRIEGKSTWGRRGLLVHLTAGFVDPGFQGQLTLEFFNASPAAILLHPGCLIAQMSFHILAAEPERSYGSIGLGSHYQGQSGATPSFGSGPWDVR